ncbi:MAG: hypothetical protein K0R61_263 [Microvirga sp.]|jgi:hypothetical protein|nr:hypothetical protein [Microvirga sp.]
MPLNKRIAWERGLVVLCTGLFVSALALTWISQV